MVMRDRSSTQQIRIVQPPSQEVQAPAEEFKADPDSLNMLLEMGYSRDDAQIALKITQNNLEQACTFLLNNPNPAQSLGYQVHMAASSSNRHQMRAGGAAAASQASRSSAAASDER